MKRSEDRILTTHCGSLPRPDALRDLLVDRDEGKALAPGLFESSVRVAVADVVKQQVEAGLDVVNDGEQSKIGFTAYVSDRLTGFEGPNMKRPIMPEAIDFPGWAARAGGNTTRRACNGPIEWKDFSMVEQDIANFKEALAAVAPEEAFMTAASPGTITNHHPNQYFPGREQYLHAVADVMKREYDAIVGAGFVLQLDCPDLALHNVWFPDLSLADFQKEIALNIEALNYAVRDIAPEKVRVHVCWGAGERPHNHDPELKDIIDYVLNARAQAISMVGANGRHEHEWQLWRGRLRDGQILIPGVVDNTTNIVEHPQVVADRLVAYASAVGPENVIAGVDCGFATGVSRGLPAVDPRVAWAKLRSLTEGAAIASKKLWRS